MDPAELTIQRRAPALALTLVAAATLAFVALLAGAPTPEVRRWLGDLSFVIGPLVAVAACLRAAVAQRELRRAWILVGTGAAIWALAGATYSVYELGLHRLSPFPSLADIGFTTYSLPLCLGLLSFPRSGTRRVTRARTLLDASLVAASVLFASWSTVLGATLRHTRGLVRVDLMSYPTVDVILISLVLALTMRKPRGARLTFLLLGGGVTLMALTDSRFVLMSLRGSYSSGSFLDAGWLAAFLLVAAAASVPRTVGTPGVHDERRLGLTQDLIPYLPFVVGGVCALRGLDVSDPVLRVVGVVMLGLFLARQVSLHFESVSLTTDLDAVVERRTTELETDRQHLREAQQMASIGSWSVEEDGDRATTVWSDEMYQILGLRREEVQPSRARFLEAAHPADRPALSAFLGRRGLTGEEHCIGRILRPDGSLRWILLKRRDTDTGRAGMVMDITERQEAEQRLEAAALSDPLTGLANRTRVQRELASAMAGTRPEPAALMVLDLDDFKLVNDTAGHSAGDALLLEVSDRLRWAVRAGDTVGRLGGDEFVVVMPGAGPEVAERVAHRIRAALARPVLLANQALAVRFSVGIATTAHGADESELLRNADIAMYVAKARGKDRCEVFEPSMLETLRTRRQLESELLEALAEGQFRLQYQPVIEVATDAVVGVEALVRWDHPERGLIPPAQFLPLAEDNGSIVELGAWVLRRACQDGQHLSRITGRPLTVAVNVSVVQLDQPGLVAVVTDALLRSGLEAHRLVLEVTETGVMREDDATLATLTDLRRLGVQIAIDDFGTGYSSLSRLRRLPVSKLKIDKSFIDDVCQEGDQEIIAAIITMAHMVGLTAVAEGIETSDQLSAIAGLGCDDAQGYLFSPPLDVAPLAEWMAGRGEDPSLRSPTYEAGRDAPRVLA